MTPKGKPGRKDRADGNAPGGATNPQFNFTIESPNLSNSRESAKPDVRQNDCSSEEDLLELVLSRLNRGDAPDRKFPDRKGEYWPLCEFHPDRHHGSFCVSERGYKCFACGASGSLRELAKHLGLEVAELHAGKEGNTPPSPSLTLKQYAECKRLPLPFLEELGLEDIHLGRKPAVKMPYYDENGEEVSVRLRLSLNGRKNRFRWRKGSKPKPYGLWKLDEARKAGHLLLVEGESDTQTLWHHGIPALGLPGASTWKTEWGQYVDGLKVFIWREPDNGGAEFVKKIGEALPEAQVLFPPEGRKDISECHMLGDDVPGLLSELMKNAVPYERLQEAALQEAVEKARADATKLLSCPDILGELSKLVRRMGLVGEDQNAKILYLAVTSRLLDKPINVVVKGPSSGGKSFTVEIVLKTVPESAFYLLSGMSEKALAYSQEPLQHRLLIIYEAAGLSGDFQAYLVRSLLSEGRIRYETVVSTRDGLEPRLIEREGPTGLIITTTWASLHPENETRMLSLTVRDDPDQTKGVLQALADQAARIGSAEPDLTPWHALQTWLELGGLREVFIPYAPELAELANPLAVRLRRDFSTVLTLIRAHAVLHQEHRGREDGHIVATLADYRAVYELVSDLVSEGAKASVSKTVRETVEAVAELLQANKNQPVMITQVARLLNLDDSAASRRVKTAIRDGYIINQEDKRGRPARLVLGDPMPDETSVLPHPDALEEGEGGEDIPPVCTATVQSCESEQDQDLWEGTL